MDITLYADAQRAARRREQNRTAQRNYRKRKQMTLESNDTNLLRDESDCRDYHQSYHANDGMQKSSVADLITTSPSQVKHPGRASITATASECQVPFSGSNLAQMQAGYLSTFDQVVNSEHFLNDVDPQQLWHPINASDIAGSEDQRPYMPPDPDPTLADVRSSRASGLSLNSQNTMQQQSVSPYGSSSIDALTPYTLITEPSPSSQISADSLSTDQGNVRSQRSPTLDRSQQIQSPKSRARTHSEVSEHVRGLKNADKTGRRQNRRLDDKCVECSADCSTHGQTCLQLAAAEGSVALVKYFLALDTRPNTRDGDGLTALHHAVRGGHGDAVSALISGGADMEVKDNRGRTALHLAIEERQDRIAMMLVREGADVRATVYPDR